MERRTIFVAATLFFGLTLSFNNCGKMGDLDVSSQALVETIPNAPADLAANAISSIQINLTWLSNSNTELGFKIERAPSSAGPFAILATLDPGVISYSDSGLTGTTNYFYRVYAFNDAGSSGYSNVASATTLALPPPATPSNLVAIANSQTQINLSWVDNSNDENGFRLERATSLVGPYTSLIPANANVTTYSDTGLTANTRYYYRLLSFRGMISSGYSNIVNVATMPPPNTPAFVSNVVAIAGGARIITSGPVQAIRYFYDSSNGAINVPIPPPYSSPFDVPITFPAGTTFVCFQVAGSDGVFNGPVPGDPQQCNSAP